MTTPVQFRDVAAYAQARDALRERLTALLRADPRVAAAWLAGSFGRGSADSWSDLDVHVAMHDAHVPEFVAEREQFFARLGAVVVHQDVPGNAPSGGAFSLVVYPGVLEVDWTIVPLGQARRPRHASVLFDHVGIPTADPPPAATPEEWHRQATRRLVFFWAMAPTALKLVGRDETARTVNLVNMMTDALIHVWRLIRAPTGPNPAIFTPDRLLEPELEARLPRLGRVIDPVAALAVIRGLLEAMTGLHPILAEMGVLVPSAAPAEMAALAALVENEMRRP